jgi:hypothetical protein
MSWHEGEGVGREPYPRLEDIPSVPHGLDPGRVAEAFERFERELSRQRTRQLPALPDSGRQEARLEALKLIRAAAEFADVLERDAQEVAARQMAQVHRELDQREAELRTRESALLAQKDELERRRSEILAAAERQADEIVAAAQRAAVEARHEAELAKLRVLEEARGHIGELTAATRAEVERTLEWSRAQAEGIVNRARSVAEQLLSASLRGQHHVVQVVDAIVRSTEDQLGPPPAALTRPRPPELEAVVPEPAQPEATLSEPAEAAPSHEPKLSEPAATEPRREAWETRPAPEAPSEPTLDEPRWPWERAARSAQPGEARGPAEPADPAEPGGARGTGPGLREPPDPTLRLEAVLPPPPAPRRFAWPLGGERD